MAIKHITLLLTVLALTMGQRPFFAGTKPIGYPQEVVNRTSATDGDRSPREDSSTTTQRLPIEALGDRELVLRLKKLPLDKQPFWLINWQALEANRRNPQTYQQRPSYFGLSLNPTPSSQTLSSADSLNTAVNTASIGLNTANVGPTSANTDNDLANISPNSASINPSSASIGLSFPVASINYPNINANPNSPPGSGFTSSVIGFSNSSPGDRNPVLPLDSQSEGSKSKIPSIGFEKPTNGFANNINNFASPTIGFSDSESDKRNSASLLGSRNEGFASIIPTKSIDFVKPVNDFANPGSQFTSLGIGTSNIASSDRKVNRNPVLPLDNGNEELASINPDNDFTKPGNGFTNVNIHPVVPLENIKEGAVVMSSANWNSFRNRLSKNTSANRNIDANPSSPLENGNRDSKYITVTSAPGTENINRSSKSSLGNEWTTSKHFTTANTSNRNSDAANGNKDIYPEIDNVYSFSHSDMADIDFEYDADDFFPDSNEDQRSGHYQNSDEIRKWLASTGDGKG